LAFDHHRHGVPTDVTLDAPFDFPVAGVGRFFFRRDGIDIRRADRKGNLNAGLAQAIGEFFKQLGRLFRVLVL
jgi:hypothetical protein